MFGASIAPWLDDLAGFRVALDNQFVNTKILLPWRAVWGGFVTFDGCFWVSVCDGLDSDTARSGCATGLGSWLRLG